MSTPTARSEEVAMSVMAATVVTLTVAGLVVAATALFVVLTGESADARRTLGFGFGGVDRSLTQAASIAAHNAKFAAATLVCAAIAPRLHVSVRATVDLLLGVLLAVNAAVVGVAFGAYGWRAIAATAAHLPLEFTGLSLAGGAYLHTTTHRPLSPRALAAVAGGCAVLLGVAAVLEIYVSLGGTQ